MLKSLFLLFTSLTMVFLVSVVHAEEVITAIHVKGNRAVSQDGIKAVVKVKEGSPLRIEEVRESIKSIFEMGYFTDVQADLSETGDSNILTFIVSERPQVREIEVSGNKEIEKDKLKELLAFKTYTILDLNKVFESIEKMKLEYEGNGYYIADIQYRIDDLGDNQVKVTFEITENEKVSVKSIGFTGNTFYSDEVLKGLVMTKEGGWYSWLTSSGTFKQDALRADMELLSSHYLNNGFVQVRIEDPRIFLTPDRKWIFITFSISEGNSYKVGNIEFRGDILDTVESLSEEIKLTVGETFSRDILRQDILKLTDLYGDSGYAFANVVPLTSLDEEKRLVNLVYDIRKGDPVYFERIRIIGNTKTRDRVIRRDLKISEGELYNGTNLRKSRQKLSGIGFFDEVNISTERGSSTDKLNVTVEVKERPTGNLSVGAGYSSIDSFMGTVQVSEGNLFGMGQKIQFSAEYGERRKTYNIGFTEPRLLDSLFSLGFDLYNIEKDYPDFSKKSNGGDIRLGFPLIFEDTRGNVTYRYEEAEVFDIADDAGLFITEQEGTSTTSSLTAGISRNTTDSYIAPTSGSNFRASAEFAGDFLGGTRSFVKYEIESSLYYPLVWDTTFMLHGTIGLGDGREGDDLPITERYFPGGMNTVRGFEPRSLGPRDENNNVIGGSRELIFNAEYIFPLAKEVGLKGVLFFDAGNAFADGESYDIAELRTSTGGGFRWYSPMGPLRLEWGYNLAPKQDESRSRWEFSIGTFF